MKLLLEYINRYGEAMEQVGYCACLSESDPIMIKARKAAKKYWQQIIQLLEKEKT